MKQPHAPPPPSDTCPNCNEPGYSWFEPCPNCGWASNKLYFLNPLLIAAALVILGTGSCSIELENRLPQNNVGDMSTVGLTQFGSIVIGGAAFVIGIVTATYLFRTGKITRPNTREHTKFAHKLGHKYQGYYRSFSLFGAIASLGLAALTPAVTTQFLILTPIPFFLVAAALSLLALFMTPKVEGDDPPPRPNQPPTP